MDFELRECCGILTWGDNSLDISFDLFVDRYGEVAIQISEVPFNRDTRFLHYLMNDDGDESGLPTLLGKHPDGTKIDARFLQTVSSNMKSGDDGGTRMNFRMLSRDLSLTMEAEDDKKRTSHRLEYIFPKLKCFRVGEIETPEGRFSVGGEIDIGDHNELGGIVTVELLPNQNADLDLYDGRVEALLDYLSLANGRLLPWSVRKHFVPGGEVVLQFRGKHADAGLGIPLFPYLHLRPAVEAALTNVTIEDHKRLGVNVAISWALLNSQFTEANFQGMMTALEHLIHVGLPSESKGSLFPRAEFRSMRPQLANAIKAALVSCGIAQSDDRLGEFSGRIGNLNHQSFRSKVLAYLEVYRVPADDLIPSLSEILELRNQVVHNGLAEDYRDEAFYDRVDKARELLSRIFMTHLSYSGPYESHIGGHSTKQFGLILE